MYSDSPGCTSYLEHPKMQDMFDIVDAFVHRDKMLMPKYVINASNDEFFLPTDTGFCLKNTLYLE